MEQEDLGPPTFAETVVRYRGQLLELKTSINNQTGFHNMNCAKDKRGRKNPYYAKFLPPGEKKQRMLPRAGVNVSYCRGRCRQAGLDPGMWRRSRSCEPLFLSASLAGQPRCAAARHCVSYHVYASRLTHTHTLMSQEVQLMRLVKIVPRVA